MTYRFTKKLTAFAMIALLALALLVLSSLGAAATARADDDYEGDLILEPVVVTTASEVREGVYRSIEQGDTFTVTYKLVKNDGLVDAIFTPVYDKDAFELTSFTVDKHYWSLFNNYGGSVLDPQTNQTRPMTAAEYIADRNAKYAAGEIENFRLSFILSYSDVRDPDGILSDTFITIVYTARADMVAPLNGAAAFTFGFDTTSLGGFYTNASKSGDKLLNLLLKTGEDAGEPITETLGADTFSFSVIAETAISIPEDQTITFKYDESSGEYYFDPADIELTFDLGDAATYFADEGSDLVYTFYKKVGDEYIPITDEVTGDPALPSLPDLYNVYVSATIPSTEHFDGSSAEMVHIAVAPIYIDLPNLRLYDSVHGDTPFGTNGTELSMLVSVTYGTTFDLKEVVNNEEVDFAFPEAGSYVLGNYCFDYQYFEPGESSGVRIENNPLEDGLDQVGTYRVLIMTANPVYVQYAGTSSSTITITVEVTKATIQLYAYINGGASHTITYGDPVPDPSIFTCELTGIFETGDAREDILEEIGMSVSHFGTPYTQYAPVGTYRYYAKSLVSSLDNYNVYNSAFVNLVVEQKALTITPEYHGNVVAFTVGGIVNEDEVTPTYTVGETALVGTSYAATESDYEICHAGGNITATVAPNAEATNYKAGSIVLAPIYQVSFLPGDGFGDANNVPSAQFIFGGSFAAEPDDVPHFYQEYGTQSYEFFAFRYWTLESEEYLFDSTAVTEDITLYAFWEKTLYAYKFRAINSSADKVTGSSFALVWDELAEKFTVATTVDPESGNPVAAATADAALFTKGTLIPSAIEIKGFYLNRWFRVIPQAEGDPLFTEVSFFDVITSIETDEDAYYLAEMVMILGRGDVNGDGLVTALDLLSMKRYLVGATYREIATEQEAWDVALREDPDGGYFYLPMWDANGDNSFDTRDIVCIREALATGYGYTVATDTTADGVYCPGAQIARENGANYEGRVSFASNVEELNELLEEEKRVVLTADIPSDPIVVAYDGNVYVDLDGHTITADLLDLTAAGTITILNGRLNVETLALTAPSGITITDVTDGAGAPLEADGTDTQFGFTA